jgi:BirA family biotin operon repressor/biotin-[acetyl-CoA-carboxylase] ligase
VAVATAEALRRTGLRNHGVKWPNDILAGGRKLAGILVELKTNGPGATVAVIGVGINLAMPAPAGEDPDRMIDRPWTDLASHVDEPSVAGQRNRVATLLLDQLLAALGRFESTGFDSFRDAWNRYDLLAGEPITLETGGGPVEGTALGINDAGELLVENAASGRRSYHAGEVRVFREIRTF